MECLFGVTLLSPLYSFPEPHQPPAKNSSDWDAGPGGSQATAPGLFSGLAETEALLQPNRCLRRQRSHGDPVLAFALNHAVLISRAWSYLKLR